MYRSFNFGGALPDYDALSCPALIVQGDRDQAVTREQGVKVAERFKQRPGPRGEAGHDNMAGVGSHPGGSHAGGNAGVGAGPSIGSARGVDGPVAAAGTAGASSAVGPAATNSGTRNSSNSNGSSACSSSSSSSSSSSGGGGPVTEYVELASCGHIPMEEQPAEYASAVVEFVGKLVASHEDSGVSAYTKQLAIHG